VTETVYALLSEPQELQYEVHIITTAQGRHLIERQLLDHGTVPGALTRLCRDYAVPREHAHLTEQSIHVARDAAGAELDDIDSTTANEAMADLMTRVLRELTDRDDTAIHVSLAGGRKSMGFLAGYALSLFGRPQDRLTHVLVSEPFDRIDGFFFPPRIPVQMTTRHGDRQACTSQARVTLADIPFVRLRERLPPELLHGERSFSEVVRLAQAALSEPRLEVDVANRIAWAHGRPLKLSNLQFLWLYWLASRVQNGLPPVRFDEAAAADLRAACQRLEGNGPNRLLDSIDSAIKDLGGGGRDYFERARTRLNKTLRSQLGEAVGRHYEMHSSGRRLHTVYGLRLKNTQVRIEETQ
jgi:CRISPR-associated protein (TIGR02584 family)